MSEYEDGQTGEVKSYRDDNHGFATYSQFLEKMKVRGLTPDGASQIPDPTPMEPPIGYVEPPDLMESIRQMVRSELLKRSAEEEGFESEEEAGDFEMEEDDGRSVWETLTPYEQAELEGMSARKHYEAATAESMSTPVNEAEGSPEPKEVMEPVAPQAPEPPRGGSAASSSAAPSSGKPPR